MEFSPEKIELSSLHQSQMGSTQKSQFFPNEKLSAARTRNTNKKLESIDNENTSKYYILNKPKNIVHLGSEMIINPKTFSHNKKNQSV